MRSKDFLRYAACAALVVLGASQKSDGASSACNASDCLVNSAVSQKLQPTGVTTDDRGDMSFFSSQSGQLPNVVFILDNSTSMYELPYDGLPSRSTFPDTSWLNRAWPPAPAPQPAWTVAAPVGATPDLTDAASCHSNAFFESLKDANASGYKPGTTYAAPDPDFSGFFNSANVYKFVEWTTGGGPGGVVDGTLPSSGTTGITAACNGARLTATQKRRCQQCIEESGYYIRPNVAAAPTGCTTNCTTAADTTGGNLADAQAGLFIFKGNFLNFYPPKFILARKVLTDFIRAQSTTATPVRIGIATYDQQATINTTTCPNGSIAADCPFSFPAAASKLRVGDGGHLITAGMAPDCNVTSWLDPSTHAPIAKQASLVTAVENIDFGSGSASRHTPLAETLFNVGQFLSGSDTYYTNNYTSSWLKPEFTSPTDATKPFCVSCQSASVILITDGLPSGDNNLPDNGASGFRQSAAAGCPSFPSNCPNGLDLGNAAPNALPQVAASLFGSQVGNTFVPKDLNSSLTGTQNVTTHVIALGVSQTQIPTLLKNTAAAGGGQAFGATSSRELQQRLADAVGNVVTRGTAFSSASLSSLQTSTSGSSVYVPRFTPASQSTTIWKGQLLRFNIKNDFTTSGSSTGTISLVDFDKDVIVEDDKGNFVKDRDHTLSAVPIWDAGTALQGAAGSTSFSTRKIWTAVSDGAGGWTTIPFVDTDTTRIGPTLGLTDAICGQIQAKMTNPPSSGSFQATSASCIQAVIRWARGQDIFGVNPNVNRNPMLGDIFHSSPITVDPPVDKFICAFGLSNQCLSTLFGYSAAAQLSSGVPQTPDFAANSSSPDSYEQYWLDHETRPRVVMVGANDAMVHAFNGGTAAATPAVVRCGDHVCAANEKGLRTVDYNDGDGSEQWAFIPPDQLPRLALMMTQGHQFSMDGDIMVRDVWVDGKGNDKVKASFSNQSLVKQPEEFHTVAVVSERQGGNHFIGLDVTDTLNPKMLWMYPPPCDPDEQVFGQSWAQYAPHSPPIGPVLLQTTDQAGQKRAPGANSFDHTEERWVVFLNGGHSPWNTRGRALAMLDVYSGKPLFKMTYDPTTSPASAMRFGFAAPVAMVDYQQGNITATDGFFDTAVVGDEGGQVWTAHFLDPGHINSTTLLVDNWLFGRAFEPNPSTSGTTDPRQHQPIFTLASTTIQPNNQTLRAFVGTGDRAHIRSTGGGDCRPDDPGSCVAMGCTVSSSMTIDNGPNHYKSTYASAAGNSSSSPAFAAPTQALSTTLNSCTSATAKEEMTVTGCSPGAFPNDENMTFSCSGAPLICSDGQFNLPRPDTNRNVTTATATNTQQNFFMGLSILTSTIGAPDVTRKLDTATDVATYDSARLQLPPTATTTASTCAGCLTDVTDTGANGTSISGNIAGRDGSGWVVRYKNSLDEKTATGGALFSSCIVWSSLTPTGGTVGCGLSGSTSSTFQADVFTGAPNCVQSFFNTALSQYARFQTRDVIAPPPEATASVAIGPGGRSVQTVVLQIAPSPGGGSPIPPNPPRPAPSTDLLKLISSVPLTPDQHACRHGTDLTKCP